MAETRIKESLRYRKVGGGFLVVLGLILTLFTARFVLPYFSSGRDLIILSLGPSTLALGLWAAFPRRAAALRMVITDNTVQIKSLSGDVAVIQLSDLQSIAIARPLMAKFERLTLVAEDQEHHFDVAHLTHETDDIVHLISMRLENKALYLEQELSPVMGAGTGVWHVRAGNTFGTNENRAKIGYGRE